MSHRSQERMSFLGLQHRVSSQQLLCFPAHCDLGWEVAVCKQRAIIFFCPNTVGRKKVHPLEALAHGVLGMGEGWGGEKYTNQPQFPNQALFS